MPLLTLENVSKLFGRFAALRNFSAGVEPGQLYAVFGENGAGKSTLLRIIAGLARPTSGALRFLSTSPPRSGYMAHASMLYDELSAMENLRYFASLYGIRTRVQIHMAMDSVGLDPGLERRVGDYSQGMRQRLSLARAVLHDPELLLLDEPFSNLDPDSAAAISKLMSGWRDAGKTLLVVTHQAAHLRDIADRSWLLRRGELAAEGKGTSALSGGTA